MFPGQNSIKPPSKKIEGPIIKDWVEDGKWWQIEQLPEPRLVGAGLRPYRLWLDGFPASGGQWHYTIDSAIAQAEYVNQCSYGDRIRFLETRVQSLEGQCAQKDLVIASLREQYSNLSWRISSSN